MFVNTGIGTIFGFAAGLREGCQRNLNLWMYFGKREAAERNRGGLQKVGNCGGGPPPVSLLVKN